MAGACSSSTAISSTACEVHAVALDARRAAYRLQLALMGPSSASAPDWTAVLVALGDLEEKAKKAVQFIGDFEAAIVQAARRRGGRRRLRPHPLAEPRPSAASRYLNCGDWVESCTVLAEHFDGRLELLRWRTSPVTPGRRRRPGRRQPERRRRGDAGRGAPARRRGGTLSPRPTARSVMRGSRDGWTEGATDDISTRHPTRMRVLFLVQGEGRGHLTQALALAAMLRQGRPRSGRRDGRDEPHAHASSDFFLDRIGAPVERSTSRASATRRAAWTCGGQSHRVPPPAPLPREFSRPRRRLRPLRPGRGRQLLHARRRPARAPPPRPRRAGRPVVHRASVPVPPSGLPVPGRSRLSLSHAPLDRRHRASRHAPARALVLRRPRHPGRRRTLG